MVLSTTIKLMKNNKGITLAEVIITLGVLGVLASIAVVNYGSHKDPTYKNQLLQSAKMFSMSVKNCIINVSSMGGWKIKQYQAGDTTEPTKVMYPCKATNKAELEKKLGWDCPSDSTCTGVVDSAGEFYCLDIRQDIKGKKYQCIVHFKIVGQTDKIYCGTPASWTTVSCGDSPPYTTVKESDKNKWPEPSSTPKNQGDANIQ